MRLDAHIGYRVSDNFLRDDYFLFLAVHPGEQGGDVFECLIVHILHDFFPINLIPEYLSSMGRALRVGRDCGW